ncbi:MAG TPA: hypothetical protein VFX65_07470 [Candidatus Limnocylindrales bacterium]|jgi:hypothetical protein|nr:hypothetical protein [Candidatus Limnocylindrales bacterium]
MARHDLRRARSVTGGVAGFRDIGAVRVTCTGRPLEPCLHAAVDREVSVLEGHGIAEQDRHALLLDERGPGSVVVHAGPRGHGQADPSRVARHQRAAARRVRRESGSS